MSAPSPGLLHDPSAGALRLFAAIALPDELKAQIGSLCLRLQKGFTFGGAHPAWVPPENLHLTLVFIGNQPPEMVPQILAAMRTAASAVIPFSLSLGGLGLFPTPKQPKVISLDVRGAISEIGPLHDRLRNALFGLGMTLEKREHKPHLTLARIKSFRGLAAIRSVIDSHDAFGTPPFEADSITLYQSILTKSAPEYRVLGAAPLGG